jgi:hypothetical protein
LRPSPNRCPAQDRGLGNQCPGSAVRRQSSRGCSIVYSLYDNHVAHLLDEAVYHSEHLRLGLADRLDTAS